MVVNATVFRTRTNERKGSDIGGVRFKVQNSMKLRKRKKSTLALMSVGLIQMIQ